MLTSEDGETTEPCKKCTPPGNSDGEPTGYVFMFRCPSHYKTDEIAECVNGYSWLKRSKKFPVEGGLGVQSTTFLSFVELMEGEKAVVMEEQAEERRVESEARKVRR